MSVVLSDVKRRLGTTRQIRKVTGTLQKVASARLARDRRRVEAEDVYFAAVREGLALAHGAAPEAAAAHALMVPREVTHTTLIIFGADRGLCGSFNTMLMQRAHAFEDTENQQGRRTQLWFRGKVVARRAARQAFGDHAAYETSEELIKLIMARYAEGATDCVKVLYWQFSSALEQSAVIEQVLPTPFHQHAAAGMPAGEPMLQIEPDAASVIDKLLPEYVRCCIRSCYWNSAISENAQRQTAMSRATENAGEMLDDLSRQYRRLRQENITTEMLELIGGLADPRSEAQ